MTTALYGGGAEAGRNDAEDPFRIPGIRGQLRFWWRATIGAQFQTIRDLHQAEADIWGSTETPSKVRLRILTANRGTERDAAGIGPSGRWEKLKPEYALFPAQEDRKRIGKLYFGGGFRLEIAMDPTVWEHVNAALWAWIAFGGIGGRTRRGLGSLYCADYSNTWVPEAIRGNPVGCDWPVLRSGTMVKGSQRFPWQRCWEECIGLLRDFRQQRNGLRGRSKWPEPDQIREKTNQHAPQHAPVHRERGFPRARLGLPIIFHFKTPGDPETSTLNVIDEDGKEARMASPVILKPWAVSPSEAVPLLLLLKTPPPENVELRQGKERFSVTLGREIMPELIAMAERTWNSQRRGL